MRLATYASVATSGILVLVKLAAWLATGSVSLLASLIDSLLDVLASVVNLFAVRHALLPPDREHRFGHGKAEPLAALGQTAFIAGSAIFLVIEAGQRFVGPAPIAHIDLGVAVMVFAIAATFLLTRFQAYVVKRTGSLAIKADSLHYVGDLVSNGAVIVALFLVSKLEWYLADPLFALGIAAYILFNARRIARGALDMLMDHELSDADRQRIAEIARAHPEVRDMHDLRTRASGSRVFIQLHLELDGTIDLYGAHRIADAVEADLRDAFPGAEVLIHQDPHGIDEEKASFS